MKANESILNSIKKFLNISPEDTSFDQDLILLINSAFMVIMQEWHGVDHAFTVEDEATRWKDFLGDDKDYEGLKQYIGLRVKLVFDPPTNSAVIEAMKREMDDLEWRMYFFKDLDRIEEAH